MSKTIKTRIQNKHDIPANWEKASFIPLAGELIIYDDHYFDADGNKVVVADTVRYKIGDGVTPINDLPFVADCTDRIAELSDEITILAVRLHQDMPDDPLPSVTLHFDNVSKVDWGDGTVDTNQQHTYQHFGDYTVKVFGGTVCNGIDVVSCVVSCGLDSAYFSSSITNVSLSYADKYYMPEITFASSGLQELSLNNVVVKGQLPNTLTKIISLYNCDFDGSSVVIPESVLHITAGAFTLHGIGSYANFSKLTFLSSVPIKYSVDVLWSDLGGDRYEYMLDGIECPIYVPYGCAEAYKAKWAADGAEQAILNLIRESDREAWMSDLADINSVANIEDGSGTGAIQQIADGVADGFDFTGKNETANVLDSIGSNFEKNLEPISGIIEYGATGEFASAFGGKSTALGRRSASFGTTTVAKGKYSFASGENSVSYGDSSFTSGMQNTSVGYASTAQGGQTLALGDASHAVNYKTTAVGDYSFAAGVETTAKCPASAAFGRGTYTSNDSQFVVGQYNEATLENAFFVVGNGGPGDDPAGHGYVIQNHNAFVVYEDGRAEVFGAPKNLADVVRLQELKATQNDVQDVKNTIKTAVDDLYAADNVVLNTVYNELNALPISNGTQASTVQQKGATADGEQSAAFAQGKTANALAFAAGPNATASGYGATAFGADSSSSGAYSFVAGIGTQAVSDGTAAFGKYNKSEANDDVLFYVGNGEGPRSRSNAFEVLKDGRAKVKSTKVEDSDDVINKAVLDSKLAELPVPLVYITWSELKALRDNANLLPGQFYRITDYVTTTRQAETMSANHRFDVIVQALSENTLSENARADYNSTDGYFRRAASVEITDSYINNTDAINFFNNEVEWLYDIWEDADTATYNEPNADVTKDDVFVRLDFEPNNNGVLVPVLYKTNINEFQVDDPDFDDKYYYVGEHTIDNVVYDKWRKIELGNNDGFTWYSGSKKYALTNKIVGNGLLVDGTFTYENRPAKNIANLQAWEIKYCLDNDTTRFEWADEGIGTGVIYYMKDEYNNECPYDFKNIMFNRLIHLDSYGRPIFDSENGSHYELFYTFTAYDMDKDVCLDASVIDQQHTFDGYTCYNNVIKPAGKTCLYLNGNIFLNSCGFENEIFFNCCGNTLDYDCTNNTFLQNCNNNTLGHDCSYNYFGLACDNNILADHCNSNTFADSCGKITLGSDCGDNTFSSRCYNITFGVYCCNNTLNDTYYRRITLGDDCSDINLTSADQDASHSNYLQNINIHRGVSGKSSEVLTIMVPNRNLAYDTNYYKSGSTEVYL